MANRSDPLATSVHGHGNPQFLIEKIMRTRIYECRYWKEHCFALQSETLVDKAVALKYVGGMYGGNKKATPFICLLLKMLQIQPEKEIILEFIRNKDYRYLRCLAAIYLRLTAQSIEVYKFLEPLLIDMRKIKFVMPSGKVEISHVDEFVDSLLTEERVCDSILPRLMRRITLEDKGQLEQRISGLEEELRGSDSESSSEDEEDEEDEKRERLPEEERRLLEEERERLDGKGKERWRKSRKRARSRSRDRSLSGSRDRRRRDRRSRSRDRDRRRRRSRSRSGDRHRRDGRYRREDRDRRDRYDDRDRRRDDDRRRKRDRDDRDRRRDDDDRRSKKSRTGKKKKKRSSEKEDGEIGETSGGGGGGGGLRDMSVEAMNKMRIAMGLKPLK
mmetsp:Transcript_9940/g.11032  ORF Transcript_9940/g.11032 Transcript_9940/m.11032 type:complete len:388 (+) Transcript_9940:41-1204(+)